MIMSVLSSCAWRTSARSWESVKTGFSWKRMNCLKPLTCLMFETSQRYLPTTSIYLPIHLSFCLIQRPTDDTVHSYSSHYGRNQKRDSSLQLADTHIQEVALFFLSDWVNAWILYFAVLFYFQCRAAAALQWDMQYTYNVRLSYLYLHCKRMLCFSEQ